MNNKKLIFFIYIAFSAIFNFASDAKRIKTKIKPEKTHSETVIESELTIDKTSSLPYTLDNIKFSGFDKPLSSNVESFFVSNTTDKTLTRINIDIEYLTTDSLQLHKRNITAQCSIPAGETRKIDIKSWDRQKSFYYVLSTKPRRQATPFIVIFTLRSFGLLP